MNPLKGFGSGRQRPRLVVSRNLVDSSVMEGRQKKLREGTSARRPVLALGIAPMASTPVPPGGTLGAAPLPDSPPKTPTDIAHDEMEDSIAVGSGAMLNDETLDDGLRRQRSAQLLGDGRLVLSTWYRFKAGSWSQASTFTVEAAGVRLLRGLLDSTVED